MNTQTTSDAQISSVAQSRSVLDVIDVTIRYGTKPAIQNVSLSIPQHRITAIIGPSGCGKSTLLRAFNRMNDFIPNVGMEGQILYLGSDIYAREVDPVEVRRRIGMVFQKPNPFPKSILQNVAWGPSINGFTGNLEDASNNPFAAPPFGKKSATDSTSRPWRFPEASSKDSASPAPWPWSRTLS